MEVKVAYVDVVHVFDHFLREYVKISCNTYLLVFDTCRQQMKCVLQPVYCCCYLLRSAGLAA